MTTLEDHTIDAYYPTELHAPEWVQSAEPDGLVTVCGLCGWTPTTDPIRLINLDPGVYDLVCDLCRNRTLLRSLKVDAEAYFRHHRLTHAGIVSDAPDGWALTITEDPAGITTELTRTEDRLEVAGYDLTIPVDSEDAGR